MALNPGDVIDEKYRIVRLLGEGGMGAVYEGENTRIHRRVAIKVLHAEVASSQDAVQRFEREAQAAGRIGSEHIVEVLDLGILPAGDRYMVMEFMNGTSLADRISESGKLSQQITASIAVQLLEGLGAAHDAGIIHRDLKPDNVYLISSRAGRKDFVKILDFGISKFNALGGEFSMTRTGAVMGTPYYMAPEQAKGARDLDLRADLYAVGVILYEATAGEVPFNADTFNELLFKIVLESPPPLADRVPGLDPQFAAIVSRAMSRDPGARFQSAGEFQRALTAWLASAPALLESTNPQGTPSVFDSTSLADSHDVRGVIRDITAVEARVGGAGTQASWTANDGPQGAEKKRSRGKLAVAAVAILVAAGIATLQFRSKAGEDAARIAATAKAEAEKARIEQRAVDDRARLEAERLRIATEHAKAEQERLALERERIAADLSRAEAIATTKPSAAKPTTANPKASPATARPATSAPTPQAPPSAPASTGRVIRTDL